MDACCCREQVHAVVAQVLKAYRRQVDEMLAADYYCADRDNVEMRLAKEIKHALDRELRSNWNVFVGAAFRYALDEKMRPDRVFDFPIDHKETTPIRVLAFESHCRFERFIM